MPLHYVRIWKGLCDAMLLARAQGVTLVAQRWLLIAHTGSRTRVTSMGGLYDAATLCALKTCCSGLPKLTRNAAAGGGGMEPKGPGLGPGLGLACSWLQGTRGPCLVCTWSHAGLNRGPYGYWPYALTS